MMVGLAARRLAWSSVWLLLLAPRAAAAPPGSPDSRDGVVRVFNQLEVEAVVGSGTLVRREGPVGIVLSCAHLFSEGRGELYILGDGPRPQRALLLGLDERNDLSCFAVARPQGAAIPVAGDLPRARAALESCGYGQQGAFAVNRGRLLGYTTLVGGQPQGVLEMTGLARQGDSGGPILNAQRQLVGVIIGTDGETVNGTHCRRIREFLAAHPVTGDVARRAAELAALPLPERALAYAVQPGADAEELSPVVTRATLRGRVVWGGRPVENVRVELRGPFARRVDADEQGRFEFRDVPAGPFHLRAEKIIRNTIRRAERPVVVAPGAETLDVELVLR